MKRVAILCFFLFSAAIIYKVYDDGQKHEKNNMTWHGLKKTKSKDFTSIYVPPRLQKKMKKEELPQVANQQQEASRSIASVPTTIEAAPQWKQDLAKTLLRFEKEDTQIFIREKSKIKKLIRKKFVSLRHVVIEVNKEGGLRHSYEALVGNDGKVVETWAQTKFEPMIKDHKKEDLDL